MWRKEPIKLRLNTVGDIHLKTDSEEMKDYGVHMSTALFVWPKRIA